MENDNDISFCQVSLPVDQNPVSRTCNVDIKGKYSNSTGGTERRLVIWLHRLSDDYVIEKKKTVGSSSFSLVDASASQIKSRKLARREACTSAGTYIKNVPVQQVPAARKPFPRTKVPFQKGYSQMDWLKLTRTNADLAGLKGQSKTRIVTMDEVKKHQTEGSMWTVLKGRVYNLSTYMKFHPGGVDILMKAVGKDCTALFNEYHPWVNPEFLLEKCLVGTLDQ